VGPAGVAPAVPSRPQGPTAQRGGQERVAAYDSYCTPSIHILASTTPVKPFWRRAPAATAGRLLRRLAARARHTPGCPRPRHMVRAPTWFVPQDPRLASLDHARGQGPGRACGGAPLGQVRRAVTPAMGRTALAPRSPHANADRYRGHVAGRPGRHDSGDRERVVARRPGGQLEVPCHPGRRSNPRRLRGRLVGSQVPPVAGERAPRRQPRRTAQRDRVRLVRRDVEQPAGRSCRRPG